MIMKSLYQNVIVKRINYIGYDIVIGIVKSSGQSGLEKEIIVGYKQKDCERISDDLDVIWSQKILFQLIKE